MGWAGAENVNLLSSVLRLQGRECAEAESGFRNPTICFFRSRLPLRTPRGECREGVGRHPAESARSGRRRPDGLKRDIPFTASQTPRVETGHPVPARRRPRRVETGHPGADLIVTLEVTECGRSRRFLAHDRICICSTKSPGRRVAVTTTPVAPAEAGAVSRCSEKMTRAPITSGRAPQTRTGGRRRGQSPHLSPFAVWA